MQTDARVRPAGLTQAEAAARFAQFGPNEPIARRRIHWWDPFVHALTDPMVLLLVVAGSVYLLLGQQVDGTILLLAVIPIVGLDLALELRAEQTLAKLRALTVPRARVVRDGEVRTIPSVDVVPGDLVLIQEGDIVPADGVLLTATDLQVDESALTGESMPVAKTALPNWVEPASATELPTIGAAALPEHRVYTATTVLAGRGELLVTATGPKTEYGRIGALVAATAPEPTPLQVTIARLVRRLGAIAAVVWIAVIAIERVQGHDWAQAFLAAISLAIATIPEEFPIVFALYLSIGVWRLAQRNALIRRLAGVEVLGGTSVICTDKTGTLTRGRLMLTTVVCDGQTLPIDQALPAAAPLLEAAVLACEPEPFDPLEVAIVHGAQAAGLDLTAVYRNRVLVHEYGFDPTEKLMAHVWRGPAGQQIFAKGAIEGILRHAAITAAARDRLLAANRVLASQAMRVLAVAMRDLPRVTGHRDADLAGLRVLGLIGFVDPIRPEVPAAIAECQRAGIRVIMLTGDHPITAHAVAEAIGLHHEDEIMLGEKLATLDPLELRQIVRRAAIFARIRPAEKYGIVRALQENGEVVAMTGDGINDAPALRAADVGIAMGQRGTEVAREAATMVLLDDNFATIVAAVREGRAIFQNLQRAFAYLIAFHVPIILAAFLIPLVGAPLLLLPVHLVLLELLLHPTVSLVFVAEPPAPDLMARPPRPRHAPLIERLTAVRSLAAGLVVSTATVLLYLADLAAGASIGQARALGFAVLILGQTVLILAERAPERPIWSGIGANRWLPGILGGTLATLAAILFIPVLQAVFKLEPLRPFDGLLILVATAATVVLTETLRALTARSARW